MFGVRWLALQVLLATLILAVAGERTKKASPAVLLGIKELINLQAERSVAQSDAVQADEETIFPPKNPDSKPHHDELAVNNLDNYFQGDVDISEAQAEGLKDILLDDLQTNQSGEEARVKRKVGKEPLYQRWDNKRPISYDFAENVPDLTRHKIRDALRVWEQHTCVRFRENGPDVDRLEFFDGGGCSSFVGRTGGTQGVSISTPGCDVVGIITHEVGHALGLFHEQARPDQQNHINIHYGNIPISRWNNFHPVTGNQADTFLLPYDAGSVMHYGAYGFASDPYRPTISTLDRQLQNTIGQRAGPSFLDFEAINIAYNCLGKCPPLTCLHGGYTNPNDCQRCICPAGFSGLHCEELQFSNCGAKIQVSMEPITITSPKHPEFFPANSKCIWFIQAPPGGRVFLQFTGAFHYQCEDTCDKSFVEVHTGPDFRSTGYRYCCSTIPQQQFVSVANEMLVFHNGFGELSRGFQAVVWTDVRAPSTLPPSVPLSTAKVTPAVVPTTPVPIAPVTVPTTTRLPSTTTTTLPATTTSPEPIPETFIIEVTSHRPKVIRPSTKRPHTTTTSTVPITTTTRTTTTSTTTPEPATTPSMLRPITPVRPIVPTVSDDCDCGPWSVWQDTCSQQCGGCGKRTRQRQCSSSENCRTIDKRACNFQACPQGTNFLFNNGEFHILWKGCCVGLFRSATNQCTALEDGDNPFFRIISSLLSAQDLKKNGTLATTVPTRRPDSQFSK